jgi:predicted phosphodiesterase
LFRFMHIADLHLGYEQYGLKERALDLARRFREAGQRALDERVDLVLIAGDVFHSRSVDPGTLLAAIDVLQPLREAGIPVVTVAGNHERGWRSDRQTWLALLDELEYLHNLSVGIERGQLRLGAPDDVEPSLYEAGPVRVVGLPYLGSILPRLIGQLAEALSAMDRRFTILLTHAGLEGEMPGFSQPLRQEDLRPLRGLVDYVALGHLHKPFDREDWVYNPGSLEALGTDEIPYHGGYYLVAVDEDAAGGWRHHVQHVPAKRRPFWRLALEAGLYDTPEQLGAGCDDLVAENADLAGRHALIELTVKGGLRFSSLALDLNLLASKLEERLQPLKVLVRNQTTTSDGLNTGDDDVPRSQIERRVLQLVIGSDSRYARYEEELSQLAAELKDMALSGSPDEQLYTRALRAATDLGLARRA